MYSSDGESTSILSSELDSLLLFVDLDRRESVVSSELLIGWVSAVLGRERLLSLAGLMVALLGG